MIRRRSGQARGILWVGLGWIAAADVAQISYARGSQHVLQCLRAHLQASWEVPSDPSYLGATILALMRFGHRHVGSCEIQDDSAQLSQDSDKFGNHCLCPSPDSEHTLEPTLVMPAKELAQIQVGPGSSGLAIKNVFYLPVHHCLVPDWSIVCNRGCISAIAHPGLA